MIEKLIKESLELLRNLIRTQSFSKEEDGTKKYSESDIQKVYISVIKRLEKEYTDKVKIEEIQDLIEEELTAKGYPDVYKSFSEYREKSA